MRVPVALVLTALLFGCAKKVPPEPVAGIFALQGSGTVLRGKDWRRSAQAGLTLAGDMSLELGRGSRAVIEGFNGFLIPLDDGKHGLASLRELALGVAEKRRVFWVTDKAEEREVAALISPTRYEPLQSGRKLPKPDQDSVAAGMAFFFTPSDEGEEPGRQAPPWIASRDYVRPLRRPLVPGDGARRLVAAEGFVVVEFEDHATAFAEELKLPLDLADVLRVVVIEGEAKLALPGGKTLELDDGEEAELH